MLYIIISPLILSSTLPLFALVILFFELGFLESIIICPFLRNMSFWSRVSTLYFLIQNPVVSKVVWFLILYWNTKFSFIKLSTTFVFRHYSSTRAYYGIVKLKLALSISLLAFVVLVLTHQLVFVLIRIYTYH